MGRLIGAPFFFAPTLPAGKVCQIVAKGSPMPDLDPAFLILDEAALRAKYPATHDMASRKSMTHLDHHVRDFMARSPFLCIGTQSPDGRADVSPRGDPRGFVKVLDDHCLLIPDRPGNNRLDTLANITANPAVGLLFIIPGYDDTLRINGTAQITCDPALLALLRVQDRTPTAAIHVTMTEAFMHCAKAFRRSRLWDPTQHQDRADMPSLMNIMMDQTTGTASDADKIRQLDEALEEGYKASMY